MQIKFSCTLSIPGLLTPSSPSLLPKSWIHVLIRHSGPEWRSKTLPWFIFWVHDLQFRYPADEYRERWLCRITRQLFDFFSIQGSWFWDLLRLPSMHSEKYETWICRQGLSIWLAWFQSVWASRPSGAQGLRWLGDIVTQSLSRTL